MAVLQRRGRAPERKLAARDLHPFPKAGWPVAPPLLLLAQRLAVSLEVKGAAGYVGKGDRGGGAL